MLKSFEWFEACWVWTCISTLGRIAIGPGPVEEDPLSELADSFLCSHNSLSFSGGDQRFLEQTNQKQSKHERMLLPVSQRGSLSLENMTM